MEITRAERCSYCLVPVKHVVLLLLILQQASTSASVVLSVSLLDEQQRRLFASPEWLRCGLGGDSQTSAAVGLDFGTVARGRCEMLTRDVQRSRACCPDGGCNASERTLH